MKPPVAARYDEILAILYATGARFIVVGGGGAVLQRRTGRTKDKLTLHHLLAVLRERERGRG